LTAWATLAGVAGRRYELSVTMRPCGRWYTIVDLIGR
jgi:hypothetical protein